MKKFLITIYFVSWCGVCSAEVTHTMHRVSDDGHISLWDGLLTVSSDGTAIANTFDGAVDYNDLFNVPAGAGEANTASNLGTGVKVFTTKSGVDLPFKSIASGDNITISQDINTIVLNSTGEANTVSNLGTGVKVFTSKSGVNLPLKSLASGDNVTISQDANTIVFNVSTVPSEDVVGVIGSNNGGTGVTTLSSACVQITGGAGLCDGVDATGAGSEAFPVGSVFIGVVSTNPGTLLGYGTWSAIGAGRVLVGLDSGDTDFDAVEETGGAKTKTIAQANLPNISTDAGTSHNHTQDAHNHQTLRERSATTGGATTLIARTSDTSSTVDTNVFMENTTATNQAEAAHTHSLGGSGTALNVVNPYLVVYMWKRTA